ncbi:MAG: iron ABC transporter permease [Oscillospiraceae bacterium]|nr:iron ABC transporter permease [Oscillospiraceae bacterium]
MRSLRTSSIHKTNKALIWAVLCGLAALAAVLSLCLGAVPVSLGDTLAALLGRGQGPQAQIILYARLPRTCGCLLAGMALAVAGTVIQAVLSNPMAAPNIIGVNAGAGLAVAVGGGGLPAPPGGETPGGGVGGGGGGGGGGRGGGGGGPRPPPPGRASSRWPRFWGRWRG